jgi:Flp pilus assembly protein TadG
MYSKSKTSRFEQGQGLVEFAAAGMLLLVVIVGMLDLGRALFTFITLRDAAQEGATYGSINPTDLAAIESRVRGTTDHPVNLADKSEVDVKITVAGAACAGNGVTVEVTYPHFELTTPLLGAILGSQTIPIRATVTDTILRPPCK